MAEEEKEVSFGAAEEVLRKALASRIAPGASACAGGSRGILWYGAAGSLDYDGGPPVQSATLYDLASLTKVVATTSVVMRLVAAGRLRVEDPVRSFIPSFEGGGREEVTIEQLLTHSSGLPNWKPFFRSGKSPRETLEEVIDSPLTSAPGLVERYSDIGAILLGECAARAAGKPLAALSWELVFEPLAMRDTFFRPPPSELHRIAPTEVDREYRGRLVHGEVHDENAFALGGVAGHAGLFSTAEDLGRFAAEVLRSVRGEAGPRVFDPSIARRFATRRGLVAGSSRALGWDTRGDGADGSGPEGQRSSSGGKFSPGSFGHTGFTGTSIWIDPARDLFAVLLTNRVHPSRARDGMLDLRRDFHDAVAGGVAGIDGEDRLASAARDLADAWFILEEKGKPFGYHRIVVERKPGGEFIVSDEMSLVPRSGSISFRTEIATRSGLLDPTRTQCETRQGQARDIVSMRGTIEFNRDSMELATTVFTDGLGVELPKPKNYSSIEKRPGGSILFQSLVPLLLASLEPGADGSGLGEVVLIEFPANLNRLAAIKRGRKLKIHPADGGGLKLTVQSGGEETQAAIVRFGTDGRLALIEMDRFVERRASREEAQKIVPGAFKAN